MPTLKSLQDEIDLIKDEVGKVQTFVKSRTRYWLIAASIAIVMLVVLIVTLFKKNRDSEALTILKQQQEALDRISQEQKKVAEQDRLRDSIQWDTYLNNSKQRDAQLSTSKKKANEAINRINQPDFNADSIKSWWASN